MSLWVPETARPGYVCRLCQKPFGKGEYWAYEHHVVKCGEDHGQHLADQAAERARFNAPLDPEWAAYNEALKNVGLDPEVQYSRGRRSNIKRARES